MGVQDSNLGSYMFVPDGSTVICRPDGRGLEKNSSAGSYRFAPYGSTVISSVDSRGQEHMESLKKEVVPATYKTDF